MSGNTLIIQLFGSSHFKFFKMECRAPISFGIERREVIFILASSIVRYRRRREISSASAREPHFPNVRRRDEHFFWRTASRGNFYGVERRAGTVYPLPLIRYSLEL